MRCSRLFLALLATGTCQTPSGAKEALHDTQVARLHVSTLQMIVAGMDQTSEERWIVSDRGFGGAQAVHIALCDRAGRCRWNHVWRGAYAPRIQEMGRWSNEETEIYLLTFSEGAEAESAVAIAWSRDRPPVIEDQRDGSWIVVAPDNLTLEINTSSGTDLTLACLAWDMTTKRLRDAPCTWRPRK